MTRGTWRVEWGEDGSAAVDSRAALDELLDTLAAHARDDPFIVELVSPAGDSLGVGLGRDEAVLSWVARDHDPPYYASRGDAAAEGTIVFRYRGDWSEFPRRSAVPQTTARAAMGEFFSTGRRPSRIAWDEV